MSKEIPPTNSTPPTNTTLCQALGIPSFIEEWPSQVRGTVEKWPLLSVIFTVVAGFFGFTNILTLSVSRIIAGILLTALATTFGVAMYRKTDFVKELIAQCVKVKNVVLPSAQPSTPVEVETSA